LVGEGIFGGVEGGLVALEEVAAEASEVLEGGAGQGSGGWGAALELELL